MSVGRDRQQRTARKRVFHAYPAENESMVIAGYIALGIAIASLVTHWYELGFVMGVLSIVLFLRSRK